MHGDKKDRINFDEPVAPDGTPQCPSEDPDVREVWNYTVAQLKEMGTLSTADRDALSCYCEAVVVHRKASREIHEDGLTVLAMNGATARNPAVAIQKDAATLIARYAQHFGLSPSARSEIKHPKGNSSAGGAERFLTG
ncbi:MAG: phage terminase small subunit P27 family [Actinomycetota bacterium]|nr:phage terminase small subunit P27 family [Actinomycetota bacterium]